MVDITNYIKLTHTATSIVDLFSVSKDFKRYYRNVGGNEINSLIRHFIVNNKPFAFKDKPMLYEQLTQYLADKLEITPTEIKLIGSAKTGFSISPPPDYGKEFGSHSDLDFSIISNKLFKDLETEFTNWVELYESGEIEPNNPTEEIYWKQNLTDGVSQIEKGFIDTKLIPNRQHFLLTRKINNSLWLIKDNLEKKHKIAVTRATASIYKNWNSFAGRLNRNTKHVMDKL
ncbi:MAG: hypothetical protein EO766_17570 [Hydrotalea sp. AMD]|uniref:hypothetical protein n=1 Tax=Hydrotalea sp. AMD TaxID=2501297 RepID=UPI00094357F7|nr:hypothetical protein [Hydrotalea sp. AMD]RWZ83844.1 MAG: hypothetical protein EO766_17570 [Hydrotalea sp. AMD]